ncbi:hypothetical protein AXI59_04540 [Bacillus nakamurai]|uniref:Uncharacterized protein n=1 Tax=Bacillus nakamurai TaxID=1793963 RepID=A0A150F9P0_9BACI|nr:hypothetical protein AXI59_04540 [Bacillus nakamurai]KXZ21842.1 hypothetical protein AXI58_12975 [Bacillus nakamurai]
MTSIISFMMIAYCMPKKRHAYRDILKNDLINRQEIMPWFACLYTAPESRGKSFGQRWIFFDKEYDANGQPAHIYSI